ncbi:MAG: glycosyltransferase [Bacteroidales bacterium]|jgi:glycosyltransferase involved in cell wall biosynthesis|nr:glycosyltransferase [Bacteroidales bacterium]
MVLLTRTNEIYSSPRIEKYISFFDKNNIEYTVIGWDRINKGLKRKNTVYFKLKSQFNQGGVKAAHDRIKWMCFLIKKLLKNKKQLTVIHAFDLDTAFPAVVFKFLFNRKVKVIFDICDWMSATLYNQNKIVLNTFKIMESFTIKHSDEVIICEPERIEQIPYKLNKKELVVPNIPSFNDISFLKHDDKYKFDNDNITLSYVGGFAIGRNLDELLEATKTKKINLLIAGYGSKEIEDKCIRLSSLENVKYFGKVDYKEGLNIMYNSDIIYAMYSKINPNHFYAAPNKYYEAMMLGKPIISTKGINMERKILDNNCGYIIEETSQEIISLLKEISKDDMINKGKVSLSLWNNKYENYITNFFNETYIKLINK